MDDQGAGNAKPNDAGARGREALFAALLALSGELGYERVGAETLAERAGRPVGFLYGEFSSLGECFAAAYADRAGPLVAEMLTACRGLDLASGLQAALGRLVDLAEAEPDIARALLVEVYVAGAAARRLHEQSLERLSDAVADTRRESFSSRHVPPPLAAEFIVGGLEGVVRRRLLERRPEILREEVDDLVALVAAPFQDDDRAGE